MQDNTWSIFSPGSNTFLVRFLILLHSTITNGDLAWLPGASFKRNARKWSKLADDLRNVPFNAVKDSMVSPSPCPIGARLKGSVAQDVNESERCFVSDNLQRLKDEGIDKPEEEEIIKNCAGLAYLGTSFLITFIHTTSDIWSEKPAGSDTVRDLVNFNDTILILDRLFRLF